jgi:hypothetical protein
MSHLIPLVRARKPPSGLDTSPTQWRTESSMPRFVRDACSTSTLNCVDRRCPKFGLSIRGTAMQRMKRRQRIHHAAAASSFVLIDSDANRRWLCQSWHARAGGKALHAHVSALGLVAVPQGYL